MAAFDRYEWSPSLATIVRSSSGQGLATTPAELPRTRHKRWANRLAGAAFFLIAAGAAALLWCALVIVDARRSQSLARHSLATSTGVTTRSSLPTPPATGTPLADLLIPRIDLSAVVLEGSDTVTLRRGIGHIEDTALPGQAGNVAIAGHRDTFFRPLRNVQVGDDVFLETPRERLHYRVASFRVVGSTEIGVLAPTDVPTLTLITCYPFWVLGHAPDRFVVRATRVADPEDRPH
jgi:sortase A